MHFLDTYDTSKITGFNKPYRGLIQANFKPMVHARCDGVLLSQGRPLTTISTSGVVAIETLYETPAGCLYLVETRNSVYLARTVRW